MNRPWKSPPRASTTGTSGRSARRRRPRAAAEPGQRILFRDQAIRGGHGMARRETSSWEKENGKGALRQGVYAQAEDGFFARSRKRHDFAARRIKRQNHHMKIEKCSLPPSPQFSHFALFVCLLSFSFIFAKPEFGGSGSSFSPSRKRKGKRKTQPIMTYGICTRRRQADSFFFSLTETVNGEGIR